MANTNDPNGFTPAYHMTGGTIRPAQMRIESAYGTAIYSGDVVNLSSGYIIQGTATGAPVGVFAGVYYEASDGSPTFSKYWTASTATLGSADAKAYVYNDPDIVYEAQFTAGTPAVSFIGNKYTLTTTAGSSSTGRSAEGVTATTSSGVALCVGFVDTPSNSIAAYARAFFRFPANPFE
jgi:transcription initiation factor TFIID subunit TAF12